MVFGSRVMRTNLAFLPLLILWTPTSARAEAATYEIRPAATSHLELTVEKTGFLRGKKHLFTFDRYEGTLTFDPSNPEAATVSLSIESASALCRDTWVSAKDLKSIQEYAVKDMLAVERYPKITFRSASVRRAGDGYEASGTLTIRDVSKPAVVAARWSPAGSGISIKGTSRIRLTDFKLKPPTAALGTIGTKDEMLFDFSLDATLNKAR
jgi:polyisoprenoid-binding protein YceI